MGKDLRTILRTLRGDAVWAALAAPRHSSEVAEFAQLVWAENEAAAALLEDILTGPCAWWPQRLRKTHGAVTGGMVREMLRRYPPLAHSKPVEALQLTAMAVEVAEALVPDHYPPGVVHQLRGQALRDHASILGFMGRYPESLDYVEQATRAFEHVPVPEFDLARLGIVKASALQMQNRAKEGEALARSSGETFLILGDRTRYVAARTVEAALVYDGGEVERALAIWTSIQGDPGLDPVGETRLAHNIAMCLCDLGRQEEAVDPLQRCVAEFERFGLLTERTRSRWKLGIALLATVRRRDAILSLRAAWHEFGEQNLPVDAALTAIDLADALIANEEPAQVPMICHEVIAQLTAAGLPSHAIAALSLLREAAAMGNASRELVRTTHATVRRVTREAVLFAPGAERRE